MRTLLEFEASWCSPCKMLAPRLENVLREFKDITLQKINVDTDVQLVTKYNIRAVPCLILLDETGKVIGRLSGLHTEKELKTFLSQ